MATQITKYDLTNQPTQTIQIHKKFRPLSLRLNASNGLELWVLEDAAFPLVPRVIRLATEGAATQLDMDQIMLLGFVDALGTRYHAFTGA